MTDDISKARQALRDYARTAHEIELSTQRGWVSAPVGAMVGVVRSEAAGKAFVAAQAALTVAEELRAEADKGPNPEYIGVQVGLEDVERHTKHVIAERIEAAILKALGA